MSSLFYGAVLDGELCQMQLGSLLVGDWRTQGKVTEIDAKK